MSLGYQQVLDDAATRAKNYLEEIDDRDVAVSPEALAKLPVLGGALPQLGEDPRRVLNLLDDIGSPATVATMGRRFFGGVIGGALPVAVAAHWLADAWDQNACLYDFSPVSSYLEDVVLTWVLSLLRLPQTSGVAFVTGTQMADVTALAAARDATLRRIGWDMDAHGLFGAPPITAIVGEEVHATMVKAFRLLGFGAGQIVKVEADFQGRMRPSRIPRVTGPAIVCVQVGNVNTGACDPVADICDAVHDLNAWVHVDGAFGLWAAASASRAHLLVGVDRADSWAMDAHKWLNVPHDSALAIVRHPESLRRAMKITAAYYPEPTSGNRDPMRWGPESSRRARAVEMWAALRSLGRHGVEDLIETTCRHAAMFAERLRSAGYEILNDVVLNQVLVSFGDDDRTKRVVERIQADGTCWCGTTVWKGRTAMRISVSSWATTEEDVHRSLEAMLRAAACE